MIQYLPSSFFWQVQLDVRDIKLRVSTKVKLIPLTSGNRVVKFPGIAETIVEKFPPQMITLNVPIHHLALTATMLLVVDEDKITELPMGSILKNGNYSIVDCIMSTIYTAKLGELQISDPLSFGAPVISGVDTFSPELSKMGEALVDIITSAGSDITLSPTIVGMVEAALTKSINYAFRDTMTSSPRTCEESTVVAQEVLYDPYAVEAALKVPTQAVNFANPSTPFSTWFTNLVTGVSFNKLMVGSLLNDNGEIIFDVGSVMNRSDCLQVLVDNFMGGESTRSLDGSIAMATPHGNLSIHFEEIAISGLDSLADASAAEILSVAPASPHHLKVRTDMTLKPSLTSIPPLVFFY